MTELLRGADLNLASVGHWRPFEPFDDDLTASAGVLTVSWPGQGLPENQTVFVYFDGVTFQEVPAVLGDTHASISAGLFTDNFAGCYAPIRAGSPLTASVTVTSQTPAWAKAAGSSAYFHSWNAQLILTVYSKNGAFVQQIATQTLVEGSTPTTATVTADATATAHGYYWTFSVKTLSSEATSGGAVFPPPQPLVAGNPTAPLAFTITDPSVIGTPASVRLRQFPRDDALGNAPRPSRESRSVQATARQGWQGTYR